MLDDVVAAFQDRYSAVGLAIDWTYDDRNPGPRVACDSSQLTRVFANLLENSLRYTDPGGCLRIRWSVEDGKLKLEIDDSLPGVPDEALPRLFDRFYRVDGSRSRVGGGSGLGLALCKSLIEAQEGEIAASHSSLGGLCVTLLLPCLGDAP